MATASPRWGRGHSALAASCLPRLPVAFAGGAALAVVPLPGSNRAKEYIVAGRWRDRRIRGGRVAVALLGVALAAGGCSPQAAATGTAAAGAGAPAEARAPGPAAARGPDRVVGPGGLPLAGKVIGVDP